MLFCDDLSLSSTFDTMRGDISSSGASETWRSQMNNAIEPTQAPARESAVSRHLHDGLYSHDTRDSLIQRNVTVYPLMWGIFAGVDCGIVRHSRYVTFQMAKVAIDKRLFAEI